MLFLCLLVTFSLFLHGEGFISHRFLKVSSHREMVGLKSGSLIEGEKRLFYSKKTFEDLGLSSLMIKVLKSINVETPSKIQNLSFNDTYNGRNCVIADQTGSGKTLAYLIPSIERMIPLLPERSKNPPKSPFVVVMAPTTELAMQVSKVVKTLANALKFRTACFTAVSDFDSEKKKLRLGADILVCTPGRLLALIKDEDVDLSAVSVMVLDEADILLMDHSFPLQPIGEQCPVDTQFIFTTATLPEAALNQIKTEFPDVIQINGPGLHRVAPNVEEVLIDCSGSKQQQRTIKEVFENKCSALMKVVSQSEAERTIVFCNTIEQCRRVENVMLRNDRNARVRSVYAYHGAIEATTREDNLWKFSRPLLRKPSVLICTDRASRGMDFNKAHVDHVILFDFPQEPSEYLRRVGRTGRAGRPGRATILVYGRQVEVAKMVLQASIDGKRIEPTDE